MCWPKRTYNLMNISRIDQIGGLKTNHMMYQVFINSIKSVLENDGK